MKLFTRKSLGYTVWQRSWMLLPAILLSVVLHAQDTSTVSRNDADGDRIVDTIDLDDDNDGIPDTLEILLNGAARDSDRDGIPDRLDLDSDNDGILDWQESGAVLSLDLSSLRIVSGRLVGAVGSNGLIDVFESPIDSGQLRYELVNSDFPDDNLADVLDLDSDNDGLPDLLEAGVSPSLDNDGDARIDAPPGSVGSDGIADYLQSINDQTCCDVTGDGIEDTIPRNSDQSDLPDFLDHDSDNDGVTDLVEAGGNDVDGNGRVDNFFDSSAQPDGLDDAIRSFPLQLTDTNGNGLDDHIDPFVTVGEPAGVVLPETSTIVQPADDDTPPMAGLSPSGGTPVDFAPIQDPSQRPTVTTGVTQTLADDDAPGSVVRTGLDAGGCSIQSTAFDATLMLLTIFSLSVLGWRFTVKRLRDR